MTPPYTTLRKNPDTKITTSNIGTFFNPKLYKIFNYFTINNSRKI